MSTTIEGEVIRVAVGEDNDPGMVGRAAETQHPAVATDTLVKTFVRIRDAKRAFVQAHDVALEETYEKPLRQISTELKRRMMESGGTTGLKTAYGTVYIAETVKVSCQDWGIFYDWGKKNDCLEHFLEQRIKAGEVKTYMDKHGGELPPGVSVFRETEARIRKPRTAGSKIEEESE